jgi:predicted enzyme related to lactoylglutathione lyase
MPTPAFIWYELMSTDVKAAADFYTKVVGWTAQDAGGPNAGYTLLMTPAGGVAGIMAAFEGGPPPVWMGYVAVEDVDAHTRKLADLGGSVHKEPQDIPQVGRFSVVADPQGAVFMLFTPMGEGPMPQGGPNEPGFFGWRELMAEDSETAFDFYAKLFGWTQLDVVDMGPMGKYHLFAAGGPEPHGGMMNKPANMPRPFWSYYAQVDSITAAKGRVEAAGGQVINGPEQVPTGQWILQGLDPQGAMFCLLGPE